jgi:hypothetical protein
MGDPIFLSLWLRGYSALALPVYFKKAVKAFPHSKLKPGGVLRVFALSFQEAPQLEEFIDGEIDAQYLVEQAQQFLHEDCAFQLETSWDVYQWDGEWELKPAKVLIEVYGPDFDTACGEQMRIDFGAEGLFLPTEHSDQLRPVQSNIRSLLHYAQDLENELSVDKRTLWTEEEENFADRLRAMLD